LIRLLPELQRRGRYFAEQAAEAQDLVQETCRRAIEAQGRLIPGSDLRAWLLCIMRNIHRDRLRGKGREILVGGGLDSFPELPQDLRPTWREAPDEDLGLALATLPSPYRDAFHLHAVQRLRYAEIAQRLGIPVNTVGTRLRRARLQIRRFLEQRMAASLPRLGGLEDDGKPETDTRRRPENDGKPKPRRRRGGAAGDARIG
jgi:RNA polymerase sigma-70 factor, ECF subfamily